MEYRTDLILERLRRSVLASCCFLWAVSSTSAWAVPGDFTSSYVLRDYNTTLPIDDDLQLTNLSGSTLSATHTAVTSVAGWESVASASLYGPRLDFSASLDNPTLNAVSTLIGTASLAYSYVVSPIGAGVPPVAVGAPVPVTMIGRVYAATSYVLGSSVGSEVAGDISAQVSGQGFTNAAIANLGFSVNGGGTSFGCRDASHVIVSTGTPSCGGSSPFQVSGQAGVAVVQQVLLIVSLNPLDAVDARVTVEGFADPIIAVDPFAEFEPGMRYADFFEIQVLPSGITQVPEPNGLAAIGIGLALLARFFAWRRGRPLEIS